MGDGKSVWSGGAEELREWPPRSYGSSMVSMVLTPPNGIPVLPDPEIAAAARASIISACRPAGAAEVDPCVCGHGRAAHEHYRPGWDCASCGAVTCTDYRRPGQGRLDSLLRLLQRRPR